MAVTWTLPVSTHLEASGVSVTRASKVTDTGVKVCRNTQPVCRCN